MRADLDPALVASWVSDDVRKCPDCRQVDDWPDVYDVCGWHENLVAAAAWQMDIVEKLCGTIKREGRDQ